MTRLSRPWCGLIDISLLLENLSACFCSAGWYRRVPASRAIFAFRVIFVLFLVLTRVKTTLQYLCMIETSETEQTYLLRSVVWKGIGYCLYASLYLILSFLCLILTQFPILCALEEHSCHVRRLAMRLYYLHRGVVSGVRFRIRKIWSAVDSTPSLQEAMQHCRHACRRCTHCFVRLPHLTIAIDFVNIHLSRDFPLY